MSKVLNRFMMIHTVSFLLSVLRSLFFSVQPFIKNLNYPDLSCYATIISCKFNRYDVDVYKTFFSTNFLFRTQKTGNV